MDKIKFTKEETEQIIAKIKTYFHDELNQEIGSFEAEFLIDFFAKEIGPHFYNNGLSDATELFVQQMEEASYLVEDLEKPVL